MSQRADDHVGNVKENSKCTSVKNKSINSKDPSVTPDGKSIENSEDKLNEMISQSLHIKHHNNLTNGTSDHLKINKEPINDSTEQQSPCEDTFVNSVYCSDLTQHTENTKNGSSESSEKRTLDSVQIDDNHFQDTENDGKVFIVSYESELQMPEIMRLIQKDLSEPYSIYTYRYFIHNWPKLCFLAIHDKNCIGAIVCKLDMHRNVVKRGYIAMLAVDKKYRKRGIGSKLVQKAIQVMIDDNADEVVLETEITNKPALKLYENLGFVRDKRLFRYYLNGVDALRLKLWLR
ncbi:N-alpha-acetyltransferase 30 [Pieris rapae]|uniref:N-alpha-acetyltransferase 30 n=1 Tax=Pieris rapae TaxID=64459 RepID=UPI000B92756F|nr:N-alpha-acetyltransferase 30 [Pieris rapae]